MSQILVPFDGSDNARDALSFACDTFRANEILVLFVVDTSVTYQPERTVGMKLGDIYEKREEEGREYLAEAEELAAEHGTEIVTTLTHGKPARAILEEIERSDIEHVVLGSHSQSTLERFFLGSVAERVVERSPVSVTVIR
ncbi:universal stress protein [Halovenus salina]|uniref:Universal stress protein n=1 Tax=Halovenus salina TaxID=1510225 RepID=A0ABD5W7N0_9EURY|nr:universal stress protein [Halovenus salina]